MVCRSPQLRIRPRSLHVLSLVGHWRNMPFVHHSLLFRCRPRVYPAFSTVEADARDVALIDRGVVHVANDGDVHIGDGAIVVKVPAFPVPTFKTAAEVAKAIVDPAIKAHYWAPETFIKDKSAAAP